MDIESSEITSKVQSINIKETLDKKFCDLAFSLLGKQVKVKLPDNQEGEGILYTINPKNGGVMIKNYKQQTHSYPGEENQSKKQSQNELNSTKCLLKQDFVYLFAENVDDPPYIQDFKSIQNSKNLKTDGELTKLDKNRGREFQAVDFIFQEGQSIEDAEDLGSKAKSTNFKNLDQFQINQQKFGVGTEFKDEFYTTKLDISKFDKKQIEQAEKLEQEVNKEGSKHKHVLIDRGRDDLLADSDEEKNFSAVHGSGRFGSDQNNQKGSKKEISSQNKLESKDGNQDEIGYGFGKGKPQLFNKKIPKQEESSSKEQGAEQTKKDQNQGKEEGSNTNKQDSQSQSQSKNVSETSQEQLKQITKQNENTTKQGNSSNIYVEKVQVPVQNQPNPDKKVENKTTTLPSQTTAQTQLPTTSAPVNDSQINGNKNGVSNYTNTDAQNTEKAQEKTAQEKKEQLPQTESTQSSQQSTTSAAQIQEEKPKKKKLQMKGKLTEFNVDAKSETQAEATTTNSTQNQQNYQEPQYQNQQYVDPNYYAQPIMPQNMQQGFAFYTQPPYGMPGQFYPQQTFMNPQFSPYPQYYPQQQMQSQQFQQNLQNKQGFNKRNQQ